MRLIDADALKKKAITLEEGCREWEVVTISEIDNAPTIERPQGEWINTGVFNGYWAKEYQCSICGAKDHWHNYCPTCGAHMGVKTC